MIINRLCFLFVCFTLFSASLQARAALTPLDLPAVEHFSSINLEEQITRLTHELETMKLGKKARRWRQQRLGRLVRTAIKAADRTLFETAVMDRFMDIRQDIWANTPALTVFGAAFTDTPPQNTTAISIATEMLSITERKTFRMGMLLDTYYQYLPQILAVPNFDGIAYFHNLIDVDWYNDNWDLFWDYFFGAYEYARSTGVHEDVENAAKLLMLVDKKNAYDQTILDVLVEQKQYKIVRQLIKAYVFCFPATTSPRCSEATLDFLHDNGFLHLAGERIAAAAPAGSPFTITPP